MANEAQFTGDGIDHNRVAFYNFATGTALTKGTWLASDETKAYTAVLHSNGDQIPLGVLVEDRDADDTQQDRVGVAKYGNFLCVADGAIAVGDLLELGSTANRLKKATFVSSGAFVGAGTTSARSFARVVGIAREPAIAGQYIIVSVDVR